MSLTVIDGRKMTDRRAAHEYLAEVLSLPAYYGYNLDALHDCLTDGCSAGIVLIRHAAYIRRSLLGYGDTLIEVFEEAAEEGGPAVIVTEN